MEKNENTSPDRLNADVDTVSADDKSTAKQNNPFLIKLTKPYRFENNEYTEIDLSRIEDLSTEEMTLAEKMFTASQNISIVAELNLGYCICVAAIATRKPIEFFNRLPARDGMQIKNAVALFFLNGG